MSTHPPNTSLTLWNPRTLDFSRGRFVGVLHLLVSTIWEDYTLFVHRSPVFWVPRTKRVTRRDGDLSEKYLRGPLSVDRGLKPLRSRSEEVLCDRVDSTSWSLPDPSFVVIPEVLDTTLRGGRQNSKFGGVDPPLKSRHFTLPWDPSLVRLDLSKPV